MENFKNMEKRRIEGFLCEILKCIVKYPAEL